MCACFNCVQRPDGSMRIVLFSPSPFREVVSWEMLHGVSKTRTVVALGVFEWSNYSHDLMNEMVASTDWFDRHEIVLCAFCLGDAIEKLCPALLPYYKDAGTEPAVLLLQEGSLKKVRFGRIDVEGVKEWLSSTDATAEL